MKMEMGKKLDREGIGCEVKFEWDGLEKYRMGLRPQFVYPASGRWSDIMVDVTNMLHHWRSCNDMLYLVDKLCNPKH